MEDESSTNRKSFSKNPKNSSANKSKESASSDVSNSESHDYKHFEKAPRTLPLNQRDFKETIQYQDLDSYASQRHNFVGTGLFNTDEIDDLPPRYRQKVLNAFDGISGIFDAAMSYLSEKYPNDFDESKNPEIKGILDLNKSLSSKKKFSSSVAKVSSPSKNQTYVHNEKSNSKERFNKQISPENSNFNCKDETSCISNNTQIISSSKDPKDFGKSSCLRHPYHQQNEEKNKKISKQDSTCSRNNEAVASSKSSVESKYEGFHQPSHSSDDSSRVIEDIASYLFQKYPREFDSPNNSKILCLFKSVIDEKLSNLEKHSHSRNQVNVHCEDKTSLSTHFNKQSRGHNKNFSYKKKSASNPYNKSQSNKVNLDVEKKGALSKREKKCSKSTHENLHEAVPSINHGDEQEASCYSNKFYRQVDTSNEISSKREVPSNSSNKSQSNSKIDSDIKQKKFTYRNLHQPLPSRKPVNKQETGSNSTKLNRQDDAGNKNLSCTSNLSNSSLSSGRGDIDIERGKAFISSSKSSKHSDLTFDYIHHSSYLGNSVFVQNEEQNGSSKKFNKQNSIQYQNNNCEGPTSCNLKKSRVNYRTNSSIEKQRSVVSHKSLKVSENVAHEKLHHHNSYHQSDSSLKDNSVHSSETILEDLKFHSRTSVAGRNVNEREYHVPPRNIKKTKENGFFVVVNVSDKTDDLEYWKEFFSNCLNCKEFFLEFCCKFTDSFVLNFEKKCDALKAVPILKKLKNATKNLREPHITLVSRLKNHLTRPCDCSNSMFENCKQYFNDFANKFVHEHRSKIYEVQKELKGLKTVRNKKLHEELCLSLNEKLDVLEDIQAVFKDYVSILEEKLTVCEKFAVEGTLSLKEKFVLKDEEAFEFTNQERAALRELIRLEQRFDEGRVSIKEKRNKEVELNSQVKLPTYSVSIAIIKKLKKLFSYECNSFRRCLPVYSKKEELLDSIRRFSVLVISAETGSGKTTQLAEYLLQSSLVKRGSIICTQPRKIAAVSVANFVCGQIGTAVGKLIGYDIGAEKKFDSNTKIIYMTDYALLKKLLRNRKLHGISCVIVDEAHERTLYTDLVLGMLKDCINERLDLRLIITSATIDPSLFVQHFGEQQTKVIRVPGRTYPVDVIWLNRDVHVGEDYVKECVETTLRIHQEESEGNILVFLTSPGEIDEAILMFKDLCSDPDLPELLSLHGKCDLLEQLLVFQTNQNNKRKIIFATNSAETSLTIPGIKFVVDSGRAKEMVYYPEKNKSCLKVEFINKSSAEQRKGRAGRTQPGICYRMYSKKNYEEMYDSSIPEILRTNLQKAMLKVYQFGLEPRTFSFVETPSKEAIIKSLESLEHLGLIKENKQKYTLTELGKQVVEIPTEPHLAKLVLEGIKAEIGYETIIVAALLNEAGRLFLRTEDIKDSADERKRLFCRKSGDLCTYLEVYKRWLEEAKHERNNWCVTNYVNSKALNSATKAVHEILISLHQELGIRVSRRYNNQCFKSQFERIVFNCFSENLCTFSGHKKLGYFSPHFTEALFIHPSSALNYLKTNPPSFLVYSAFMQTTRNFLLDLTPIKEETIKQAVQKGTFQLHPDMLKGLQLIPKTLGPFGELVLVRHILGKKGSKINNLESLIEKLTHCRNFQIDVQVEKGIIVIYLLKKYHETVARYIYEMVEEAHTVMKNEEETVEIKDSFSFFCIGAGGLISDIIMPGEFKEVIIDHLLKFQSKKVLEDLENFGPLQSLQIADVGKNSCRISANYVKVASAQKAMLDLGSRQGLKVKVNVHEPVSNEEPLPMYKMEVKWCRCPATGKGWVEFNSESDCITASGGLTSSSFYIEGNYIAFTPSHFEKILDMKNIPSLVDDTIIKEKLIKKLPDLIQIKNIHVGRKKVPPVTEKEMEYARSELKKLFSRSTLVDLKYPDPRSIYWTAIVYFKRWEDGVKALNDLDGKAKIDSVPLHIKVIKESHLQCKAHIFKAIEKELPCIKNDSKGTQFFFQKMKGNNVDIGFSCNSMQELFDVHLKVSQLLQGKILNCFDKKYHCLFTAGIEKEINKIKESTKTVIILDNTRKLIFIFGTKENCFKAHNEVCSLVTKNILSRKIVFSLADAPAGFLKSLYSKFGYDLRDLINKFSLRSAYVDAAASGKLVLEGSQTNLDQAGQFLEDVCSELHEKNPKSKLEEDKEICSICLDPLTFDFHRLENCGHAFCKSCLVLQIESRIIPLCCIKQDCGKMFYLVDIKRLLSFATETTRKNFYKAALHYHVNQNPGKIVYCPSPDCYRSYRASSSESEQFCLGCRNVICVKCQSLYHCGMSCEFFQKSQEDDSYSLKNWMIENKDLRKQCPSCKTLIEKDGGCNHMECASCNSHFCWLCLQSFSTGAEVYDHLPYCPNNQVAEN